MLLSRSSSQQAKAAPEAKNGMADLQARVEKMVHKAFWDEALEALNSQDPSIQIHRLHRLHADIYEAIKGLLPPGHRVLSVLSAPYPPPSVSPLHTTIALLRDTLSALKERCAPIRDEKIDQIVSELDRAPPYSSEDSLHPEQRAEHQAIASRVIIDSIQALISLAQEMKSDLTQTVLGVMTEQQIRTIVTEQARIRERELILTLMSKDTVKEAWIAWINEVKAHANTLELPVWIARLLDALGANIPVAANIIQYISQPSDSAESRPPPPPNNLPPPLFFCAPDLFRLQNHLQALVIVASLRSLVNIPQAPHTSHSPSPTSNDLTHRLWTLLETEIKPEHEAGASAGETKIVNLADEVLRARRQARADGGDASALSSDEGSRTSAPSPLEDEAKVRAAVERTLRAEDPVFALLQKRVLEWLARALAAPSPPPPVAPERMRTGRDGVGHGRTKSGAGHGRSDSLEGRTDSLEDVPTGLPPPPKGFEDAVLAKALRDAVRMLQTQCVQWVRGVWGDVVEA
ncbi:uncharacterized protein SCHCODRAFT_02585886 [Schizophyllum commune H4-8]|uniref:Expressed protein n=1 Tax=Schizophyllum commune (strain H4-8 / FGSC 9210) TaxID=578458 RepID=D8QC63_SCHCM|nr:uncharacterized protein SCHCODRAFT_02585886 [Schizophyllum commune H4-8]KAI5889452.1 hypothetical protein SCHCODRAFT_02585886 [Schizophyllum commune H4-8]